MNFSARSFLYLTFALLMGSVVLGCASRIPFTHELRHQHRLSDEEVSQLQFYVSHPVVLRRETDTKGRRITDSHRLVLTSGKIVEEVVIEEDTPGVAVAVGPQSITVSFEHGSALEFIVRGGDDRGLPPDPPPPTGQFAEPPDPFPGDLGPPPEPEPMGGPLWGNYWLAIQSDGGWVHFRGRSYLALEDSFRAHLLIDGDELEDVVESRSTLGGRTL